MLKPSQHKFYLKKTYVTNLPLIFSFLNNWWFGKNSKLSAKKLTAFSDIGVKTADFMRVWMWVQEIYILKK